MLKQWILVSMILTITIFQIDKTHVNCLFKLSHTVWFLVCFCLWSYISSSYFLLSLFSKKKSLKVRSTVLWYSSLVIHPCQLSLYSDVLTVTVYLCGQCVCLFTHYRSHILFWENNLKWQLIICFCKYFFVFSPWVVNTPGIYSIYRVFIRNSMLFFIKN